MTKETHHALALEAEAFACVLVANLITVANVVAWADSWILRLPAPPYALIAVAESMRRHPLDMVALLRELSGRRRDPEALRYILRRFGQVLRSSPQAARQIAHALYQMALTEEWEGNGIGSPMYSFDDELDLASSGIYGDPRDVIRDLQAFLDRQGE